MGPPGGRPTTVPEEYPSQFSGHRQTDRIPPLPPDEHTPHHFPVAVPSSHESVHVPLSDYMRHQQPPSVQRQNPLQNQQTSGNNLNHNNQYQSQPDQEPPGEDTTDYHHRAGMRTNVRVNVSTEQEVCESTEDLLTTFICGRMEYDGHNVPPDLSKRCEGKESAVAVVLRRMGDDISRNYELNHYISEIQVTPNTAYKTFASVACQIFKDGNINWGRVVMLFYFAYKLALQVLNQLPLIEIIIEWVTRFVSERVARWISRQGGWSAIREYYGSTTRQMVGVFLAGILVSSLFWYWRK